VITNLTEDVVAGAIAEVSASGWLGWIPFSERFTCPACGGSCTVCPRISRLLPSVFPCIPFELPTCPLKAGLYFNTTNLTSLATPRMGELLGSSRGRIEVEVANPGSTPFYHLRVSFSSQ